MFEKFDYICIQILFDMKHSILYAAVATTITLASCGSEEVKPLVLYYSQTGISETVAQELQKLIGADIVSIEPVKPYSGTYDETIARVNQEMQDGVLPELNPLKSDLSKYDVVFLAYPIWFGTYATPIASLVKDYDFTGKKVVTVCTFGSGGVETAVQDLKKALPNAVIAENNFGIRKARIGSTAKELNRFLVENAYIEGEVEVLPEYSELVPVTEEEKRIFGEACGNYTFPLGTPVLVGKRVTSEGTDYIYKVENNGANTTIYVTVANGGTPEFTRVVR